MSDAALLGKCPAYYAEINGGLRKHQLSSIDKHAIEEIFQGQHLDDRERARQVFDIVLSSRLSLLDSEDAAQIRKILETKVSLKTGNMIDGQYNRLLKTIKVKIPSHLRGTAIEYFLLMHELEHAIQDYLRLKKFNNPSFIQDFFRTILQLGSESFQTEKGAMIAEWKYLHSLPNEAKKELIRQIKEDPKLWGWEKKFLVISLQASRKETADKYLFDQWEHLGRYREDNLRREGILIGTTTAVAVPLLTYGLTARGIMFVCNNQRSSKGDNKNSSIARVCDGLLKLAAER